MDRILTFRPPRIALAYLIAATVLHLFSRPGTILFFPYPLIGILAIVIGIVLNIWAWELFRVRKTAVCHIDAAVLVQRGPYRFTRNPMYLGMILILGGIAFLLGSVVAFSAPLAFFLTMNETFIPVEERDMERLFEDQYRSYRQHVRRWL